MGTGAGPTPALWQALPQKGWSPKKGTMKVGLPASEEREACGKGCCSAHAEGLIIKNSTTKMGLPAIKGYK